MGLPSLHPLRTLMHALPPHTHLLPQPAPKLLGNALGHTHSGDSARLRASDLALACVAHFGQVLRGGKCGRFGQCGAE